MTYAALAFVIAWPLIVVATLRVADRGEDCRPEVLK